MRPATPARIPHSSRPTKFVAANQLEFYRDRAVQARAEAEEATLAHVRERCLRSEAAWTAMVLRAEHSERMRAAEERRKAQAAENPGSP